MSDVEKYGLFALVFVAGVLGLAWVLDPVGDGGGDVAPLERAVVMSRPASAQPTQPTEGRRALPVPRPETTHGDPAPQVEIPRASRSIRVPRLDEGLGAFDPNEAPIQYPGPRSVTTPQVDPSVPEFVVVKKGDTLSGLAKRHLGKASRHGEITALNPSVDARNLQPGTRLRLPRTVSGGLAAPKTTARTTARVAPDLYTVQNGDTLSQIAQKLKGSVTFQDAILAANTDVLADPDSLSVGMTLRIP
jgi:nucleoid-associated protein YgaU